MFIAIAQVVTICNALENLHYEATIRTYKLLTSFKLKKSCFEPERSHDVGIRGVDRNKSSVVFIFGDWNPGLTRKYLL